MALIQVSFMSKTLLRTVPLQVILPVDKFTMDDSGSREEKPFKTLYLLHGLFGSQVDWVSGTRIQRWAEEKNLAVVMPAGENAFYIDQPEMGTMHGNLSGRNSSISQEECSRFPERERIPTSEDFLWAVLAHCGTV